MANQLKRTVGLYGALVLGLGSMIGTGVYVVVPMLSAELGIVALYCIVLAALLAVCNGLNSAQLAVNYPVSGGTYEYGYRLLAPAWGFTAGWTFLLAKSASTATALLAFSVYILGEEATMGLRILVALGILFSMLRLVLSGLKRTNRVNSLLVVLALAGLSLFVFMACFTLDSLPLAAVPEALGGPFQAKMGWLEASALIFVAYTGYGRIATLGEEIHNPRKNITRAMWLTLGATALIYLLVGFASTRDIRFAGHSDLRAMLLAAEVSPTVALLVGLGAAFAMLGVVLNLLLGLSRMLFAMARRKDMPSLFAQLDDKQDPQAAIWGVSALIALLILLGDVKIAWTFSAFTVLIYYGICNLASIRLQPSQRIYPKWIAYVGLAGCLFLAFSIDYRAILGGLLLIAAGLIWQLCRYQLRRCG